MIGNKRKQKSGVEKGFQDGIKEVKMLLAEGKAIVDRASSQLEFTQALNILSKAIVKISSIQVANTYLLYYYRGLCYMNLKQNQKAERDFIEGLGIADEKGRIQLHNALGKCKVDMAIQDPTQLDDAIKNFQKAIQLSKNSDGDAYLSLANIYQSLKNYTQSAEEYTHALKYTKGNTTVQYEILIKRGISFREIGQIKKSTKDFQTACQLKKNESDVYFNLGLNCLLERQNQNALENFDLALEIDSQKPLYLNYKGLALYNLEQFDYSLSAFREAMHLYQTHNIQASNTSQTLYNMGNCLLKMGKKLQSLKAFETGINLCQDDNLKLKIKYSEGLNYQQLNDQQIAIAKFKQTIILISEDASHSLYLSSYYHLGVNLLKKKQYEQALECFTKILDCGCCQKCVYQMRGKTYLEAEQYQQALKDFETMLSLDYNNPMTYFYLGKTKVYLGEIDSAITDFLKAMQIGSRSSQIINGIGHAYLKANKPQKALVYANIALERSPNNAQFLVQRSMIYIDLGEYIKGIQDLTTALTITKNNPFIYYQRGIAYYRSRQFQLAIKDLQKSLQYNQSHKIQADIYYLVGISYANLEQFNKAIDPLSNAIKSEKIPKYFHQRAKCYLLLDQQKAALNDLNEVIEAQPENAFAYFRRGLAYKALKMYQNAADDFMRAREIQPDDPRLVLNKKKIYQIKYRKLCEPGEQK